MLDFDLRIYEDVFRVKKGEYSRTLGRTIESVYDLHMEDLMNSRDKLGSSSRQAGYEDVDSTKAANELKAMD